MLIARKNQKRNESCGVSKSSRVQPEYWVGLQLSVDDILQLSGYGFKKLLPVLTGTLAMGGWALYRMLCVIMGEVFMRISNEAHCLMQECWKLCNLLLSL